VRRRLRRTRDTTPTILLVVAVLTIALLLMYFSVTTMVFLQPQLCYVMGPPPIWDQTLRTRLPNAKWQML